MLILSACSANPTLTIEDDGDRIQLVPGGEVQVTLEGNITTGFAWDLVEYDAAVIEPTGEQTHEGDRADVIGAGGCWTWTLRAVAVGESPVRFEYHRPWEDVPPESTFAIVAVVAL
jgi:predicted secreted protein